MGTIEIELPDWLYAQLVSYAVANCKEIDEVVNEAVEQYMDKLNGPSDGDA